jgi:hypothetical protein
MPSKYLFLANNQRQASPNNAVWNNLPTLSQSSRECYITIINFKIVFNSTETHSSVNVKMNIPNANYFSSDNSNPVVAFLTTTDNKVYTLGIENDISILTNDNLKSVTFDLEDNEGDEVILDSDDSVEVMIKLDYIDQKQQTDQFILELPKTL